MVPVLLGASAVLVWSLVGARLERWHITAPVIMVLAGLAVSLSVSGALQAFDTLLAQRIAEVILAMLLFVDATEVRGGLLGRHRGPTLRLLLIALPLAMILGVAAFVLLLPGATLALALVVACIVVPTDFAGAATVVRDPRIPQRVRDILNVESGYNDGVVAPIFVFGLVLLGDTHHAATPMAALGAALPASAKALAVGVVVGVAAGWLHNLAGSRAWTNTRSVRLGLVALPLIAYAAAQGWHGNGFVAAFVCGVAFKAARRSEATHAEVETLDDVVHLSTLAMWFAFGLVCVLALGEFFNWHVMLFAVLALTVVRAVPVLLSLLGSGLGVRDRLALSALGPRGTASIVFGLLAFNALSDQDAATVLVLSVVTVLLSVVLHGVGGSLIARGYGRVAARTHARPD